MNYARNELEQMSLNQIAGLYADDDNLEIVKEVFDEKAAATHLYRLKLVDVKAGWQEEILQKHIQEKRNEEPVENEPVLSARELEMLDMSYITETTEQELQAKLDMLRGKRAELPEKSEQLAEQEEINALDSAISQAESELAEVKKELSQEKPKRGRPKKA